MDTRSDVRNRADMDTRTDTGTGPDVDTGPDMDTRPGVSTGADVGTGAGVDNGADMDSKLARLRGLLAGMGKVMVAFSGGVDSTFLLKVAADVLGDGVVAVTAESETIPAAEIEACRELAGQIGVRHLVLKTGELQDPLFVQNTPERCYYCKKEVFGKFRALATGQGIKWLLDGTNADDAGDFRPGTRAAAELGVRSPLREVGLSKNQVRELSRRLQLVTWNKPAMACLASRLPYGTPITAAALRRIELAEVALQQLGFTQVRVRFHDPVARVEVPPGEFARLLDPGRRAAVVSQLKKLGFLYIALDLEGYQTGSMNRGLGAR